LSQFGSGINETISLRAHLSICQTKAPAPLNNIPDHDPQAKKSFQPNVTSIINF